MTKLRTAATSDIGHLRSQNEDRFLLNDVIKVYGVADGVGGLPGGEDAAQMAVDEVIKVVKTLPTHFEPDLATAVHRVNISVAELGHRLSPNMGIGSTLTFGLVRDSKMRIAHVGDSRCYLWKNGRTERLTRDHNVESDAQVRLQRGEVVYYHQSNRNALTRCIGQPSPPEVDVIIRPLVAGERYLFCTDGVTRLIPESELGEMLGENAEPSKIIRDIVALANQRGGPDNSTAVIVVVDEP
jgi:protein phosphatase